MPQVKGEWFCAPYVGWHLCRLRLHLWSPLHSSGTFLAPLVYVLMPWRTYECYLKAYSLIDFAITLPDGVDVDRLQGGHESCLDRAWPHSSCPWLPFPSDSGIETLGGMNHVQRSKTGRVPNIIGAASLLRGDCKRYFFRDLVWLDFTRSSWVCISWRAASTSTSTWKGGQRRTDAAGRWCKRSWSSTPFQVVHFLEDNDVCLFVILPEGWKHPQISLSVVTFLRAGNRKQWTNSLSKQRVWRMRPASALNLNQDSHEAILSSKSRGRWARQRPRRRVRGCDEGGGRDIEKERLHNQK